MLLFLNITFFPTQHKSEKVSHLKFIFHKNNILCLNIPGVRMLHKRVHNNLMK